MKQYLRLFAATLTLAAALPIAGGIAADVEIRDPWARASAGMAKAGTAYMVIENTGEADRLTAASSDVSEKAELHTHIKDGDVMKMRRVDAIDVPANGKALLQPGGLHIMLVGLHAPLREGETFPVTLEFEKAGKMTVEVEVKDVGAMGPMHGHEKPQEHGHGGMQMNKQ
jgi:hypothetical protein